MHHIGGVRSDEFTERLTRVSQSKTRLEIARLEELELDLLVPGVHCGGGLEKDTGK